MSRFVSLLLVLGLALVGPTVFAQQMPAVKETASPGDFPLVVDGKAASVLIDTNDSKVVSIAGCLLVEDIGRVTGIPAGTVFDHKAAVIVGTLDHSALVREALASSGHDVASLHGQWESYHIFTVERPLPKTRPEIEQGLVIVGSDRRGTAFGVFALSEAIGVSPWYWWADIPATRHASLFVSAKPVLQGPPSVKYRGIFINDEDWGLQPWAAKTFEPEVGDIGPKTYAKVFELMLRLRANYCWPAMHPCTKAFNHYPANKRVADDYAIVMGASHCEPLLCNNVDEWDHDKNGDWDYVKNAAGVRAYWEKRVSENAQFENLYTVGMRGIHDGGMPGGGTLKEKARRLETIIRDQRAILTRHTGQGAEAVPQIFCPYKEVLNIYRTGMDLPDDITILWADDNHGYIRQLSDPEERKRSGHSGVYYHLSYWGAPADFLWLSTISPALISAEMSKAHAYGADRVWVFNVGDIKPAEKELTFAMELAWDIHRWTPDKAVGFSREWAGRVFGPELAAPIGDLLNDFYLLAQRGKPEHIDRVRFTASERESRIATCRRLAERASDIGAKVPARLKDAYFELVLYPVTGAALLNETHLLAEQARQLADNDEAKSKERAAAALHAHEEIQRLTRVYNDDIAGGKWRRIMDWQPRRQAVFKTPSVATGTNSPSPKPLPEPLATLQASDFTEKTDSPSARVVVFPGLGTGAVTIDPVTAPSVAADLAAAVVYRATVPNGSRSVDLRFLPTSTIHAGRGLRASVRINDGDTRMIDLNAQEYSKEWATNVLRGYSERTVAFHQPEAGNATVEVRFLDPGLTLLELRFH